MQWTGLPKPALVPHSVLGLSPGSIGLWADVVPGDVTQHLRLWDETGSSPIRQSSVDITSVAGSTVFYLTQPRSEALVFMGKLVGHFDRPLVADGGRVGARMPLAWFVLLQLPADTTAGVIALDPDAMNAAHIGFALENAFLKTRPPVWLTVFGGTLNGDQLESGFATLYQPSRAVIPTFPDPYAANFEPSTRQDLTLDGQPRRCPRAALRSPHSASTYRERKARYSPRKARLPYRRFWPPARARISYCLTSRAMPTSSGSLYRADRDP